MTKLFLLSFKSSLNKIPSNKYTIPFKLNENKFWKFIIFFILTKNDLASIKLLLKIEFNNKKIMITHHGGVVIGNDVFIGAGCVINRGTLDDTIIGNDVKIDAQCHISHNTIIGDGCAFVSGTRIYGSVKVGDNVKVQILKLNRDTGRISLGMKQLTASPWENIAQRFKVGEKYKGEVSNITDYGAFIELEDCIEGLAYLSELSWLKKGVTPSKLLTIGQEVEAMVLEVNAERKKLALSLKQCQPNPWKDFEENHPVGTKIEGVVKTITEFGIFVGVTDLLDGMVHVTDVSWQDGSSEDKSKKIKKGDKIEVVVLGVDPVKERISLGIKQLEDDPYAEAMQSTKKGNIVVAEIKELHNNGLEVVLDNGLTGFIKVNDISNYKSKRKADAFAVGEKIEALVLGFERGTRRVNLSIRALEVKREKEALEKYGSADSGASLGDILGVALDKKPENEK